MATSSAPRGVHKNGRAPVLGKSRLGLLLTFAALFAVCIVFSWTSQSALPGGGRGVTLGKRTLVDLTPWQTAQTLNALAVTAEETEYGRDALRLADHEVDQAFAAALRQARLQSEHRTLTGEAQALAQKVAQFQQIVTQDQAQVQSLSAASQPSSVKNPQPASSDTGGDLEVAKAQLDLDSNELADAQRDLDRASGDNSAQIQEELTAHQTAQREYESASHGTAEVAAISVNRHGTLAGRLSGWFSQIGRSRAIQQAQQRALQDATALTTQHNALEAQSDAAQKNAPNADRAARLAALRDRGSERQILSIYDDRIQTDQQLASVYGKWAAQVALQHGIVGRLILQSCAVILLILICMMLADALIRQVMDRAALERRQSQTLRSVLQLGVQAVGVVLILLVIFGTPQETPTILGLATAALTIALQDYILAFLGWFALMGKNGIHIGDWVEINGVGGEVTEVGLFTTTLLETGRLEDKGHPTGRRITFMNGFAIRGTYFNFSTSGQWMWDEISVTIPASADTAATVERIHQLVTRETEENVRLAGSEWRRGTHGLGLDRFSAAPVVNLRPSSAGVDTQIRYVTRASERFALSNRLYQRIVEMLQKPTPKAG
ncbi:MAG TPA: mechanosensitive ion channel family protein [Terracidiphilus sp.]|jgi:small-conductance mechanosensitive channel|nr:mechanosensitive ion channel family protein [Terracidiphilus sp.]